MVVTADVSLGEAGLRGKHDVMGTCMYAWVESWGDRRPCEKGESRGAHHVAGLPYVASAVAESVTRRRAHPQARCDRPSRSR